MAIDFQDLRIDQNLIPWNDLKLQGEVPRRLYFPRDVKLGLQAPILLGPNGSILARGDSASGQIVSPSAPNTAALKSVVDDNGTIENNIPIFPAYLVEGKGQKNLATAQVSTSTYISPTIDSGHHATVGYLIFVSAASGTSPTLTPNIDILMADGTTWVNLATGAVISAFQSLGTQLSVSVRVRYFRIRLVIAGTTPSFTFNLDYYIN